MATTNPLKEYWRNEQRKVTATPATDTSKLFAMPEEKKDIKSVLNQLGFDENISKTGMTFYSEKEAYPVIHSLSTILQIEIAALATEKTIELLPFEENLENKAKIKYKTKIYEIEFLENKSYFKKNNSKDRIIAIVHTHTDRTTVSGKEENGVYTKDLKESFKFSVPIYAIGLNTVEVQGKVHFGFSKISSQQGQTIIPYYKSTNLLFPAFTIDLLNNNFSIKDHAKKYLQMAKLLD